LGMPSSATRTFTDPDIYFAGIRSLQIDGVITKRGEFRADRRASTCTACGCIASTRGCLES
jgi:hypothetical protein